MVKNKNNKKKRYNRSDRKNIIVFKEHFNKKN